MFYTVLFYFKKCCTMCGEPNKMTPEITACQSQAKPNQQEFSCHCTM